MIRDPDKNVIGIPFLKNQGKPLKSHKEHTNL